MIILASDHAGFDLKEKLKKWLTKKHIEFIDKGADSFAPEDSYVPYAKQAMTAMKDSSNRKAILICGSGVGMCIVANRFDEVRAVLGMHADIVKQAVAHDDANVLCLGARYISFWQAKRLIKIFLNTTFLSGKYLKRVQSIDPRS